MFVWLDKVCEGYIRIKWEKWPTFFNYKCLILDESNKNDVYQKVNLKTPPFNPCNMQKMAARLGSRCEYEVKKCIQL